MSWFREYFSFYFLHFVVLVLNSENTFAELQHQNVANFLKQLLTDQLSHCSLVMITIEAGSPLTDSSLTSHLASSQKVPNILLTNTLKNDKHFLNDHQKFSSICKSVVTLVNSKVNSNFATTGYFSNMLTPKGIEEFTRRDEDFYIFVPSNSIVSTSLYNSDLGTTVKFKLIVYQGTINNNQLILEQMCAYCEIKDISIPDIPKDLNQLFPDFTRNFLGKKLLISAPTTYLSTCEMHFVKGRYRLKRGVHVIMINEIVMKLNMTYELMPCSAFGSSIPEGAATGVLLANGTWAGKLT